MACKGESEADRRKRAERTRWNVAYARIALGLPIKEITDRLGMTIKMVEYHWARAQQIIRGKPHER